jgi:arabinogalactan oligomer/maltooligosaccharide transport system permease protein
MISLSPAKMISSLGVVLFFLIAILLAVAFVEAYVYLLVFRKPRNTLAKVIVYFIEVAIAAGCLYLIFQALVATSAKLPPGNLVMASAGLTLLAMLIAFFLTEPRQNRQGLILLLLAPALLGISFLIIYPFIFEVKLAFTSAALSTIKNTKLTPFDWSDATVAQGWANLVALFTGPVAHDASFGQVLFRTILWTAICVFFHVVGGMALALLLNRPMNPVLKGTYRMLLIVPWAIPQTIAAMSFRNEFNFLYGFFNVMLRKVNVVLPFIGPVSWQQDPTWAFVSVLIANIWLGIPFMAVIFLGGMQSISKEYYEAAEIDGAGATRQFRNVTLPLLRPVVTPAVILGSIWTFNAINVIWLITQGGPQEKTDILVSSLYKAAFQFYRYGFSAMFALVCFAILLLWALVYLRASGGTKSLYE